MKIEINKISAESTWKMRHNVMWPDKPLDFVKLPEDEKGTHFGLFKNDLLISVVSLFINKNEGQFRKLATEVHEQGNGYGTHLMHYIINYLNQKKIHKMWCNARANKTEFYEKFGMVKTEKTYYKDSVYFIVMEKNLN